MRLGSFHKMLQAWSGKPCSLTMHAVWGQGTLVVTGILWPEISGNSLRGWKLVPPEEFGGRANFRDIALDLDRKIVRKVLYRDDTNRPYLRYYTRADVMFDLDVLPDPLSARRPSPIAV
ncbi:MAG: hypothetical protein NVSMB64_17040 [Candidatus Velthaea sp.]